MSDLSVLIIVCLSQQDCEHCDDKDFVYFLCYGFLSTKNTAWHIVGPPAV